MYENYRYETTPNYYRVEPSPKNRVITVMGSGMIKVNPDTSTITFGVVTENANISIAQSDNKKTVEKVYNALNNIGITEEQIQTITYQVQPKYNYVNGKEVFNSYEVTNKFVVTTNDLQQVGLIIDVAVNAGANRVEYITFTVQDPTNYYKRALTLAVEDAHQKAKTIATTIHVTMNEIPESVKELEGYQTPIYKQNVATYGNQTPIEPGMIEIQSSVQSTYHY